MRLNYYQGFSRILHKDRKKSLKEYKNHYISGVVHHNITKRPSGPSMDLLVAVAEKVHYDVVHKVICAPKTEVNLDLKLADYCSDLRLFEIAFNSSIRFEHVSIPGVLVLIKPDNKIMGLLNEELDRFSKMIEFINMERLDNNRKLVTSENKDEMQFLAPIDVNNFKCFPNGLGNVLSIHFSIDGMQVVHVQIPVDDKSFGGHLDAITAEYERKGSKESLLCRDIISNVFGVIGMIMSGKKLLSFKDRNRFTIGEVNPECFVFDIEPVVDDKSVAEIYPWVKF